MLEMQMSDLNISRPTNTLVFEILERRIMVIFGNIMIAMKCVGLLRVCAMWLLKA